MAEATTTIVLYRKATKTIIAEVYEGEQYWRPSDVTRYNGTLDEFIAENPEYNFESDENG